jgi:hypothetical protein
MTTFSEIVPFSLVEVLVDRRFKGATASIIRAVSPLDALMMAAVRTSETSVCFFETTRYNILECCHLHTRRRENLKWHSCWFTWHNFWNHLLISIGVRSPTGAEDFSSSPCVQTGSGAHPASYPVGTGGPFPGGKARPGRDADHSPHVVPRLRISRSYTSSPPMRLHGV